MAALFLPGEYPGGKNPLIRPITPADRPWMRALLVEHWRAPQVVSRGHVHQADALPGFLALEGDRPLGLVTYAVAGDECEIVTLDAVESGRGVGSALMAAVVDLARHKDIRRVWLITTNDNTGALRFYQKVGFVLVAVHRDAIRRSRELKPSIPETGFDGIPIRDEIELEMVRGAQF